MTERNVEVLKAAILAHCAELERESAAIADVVERAADLAERGKHEAALSVLVEYRERCNRDAAQQVRLRRGVH